MMSRVWMAPNSSVCICIFIFVFDGGPMQEMEVNFLLVKIKMDV